MSFLRNRSGQIVTHATVNPIYSYYEKIDQNKYKRLNCTYSINPMPSRMITHYLIDHRSIFSESEITTFVETNNKRKEKHEENVAKKTKKVQSSMYHCFPYQKPSKTQVAEIFLFLAEFLCYMNFPDSFLDNRLFQYFIHYFCPVAPILTRSVFVQNYFPSIYKESLEYRDKKLQDSIFLNIMIDSFTDKS